MLTYRLGSQLMHTLDNPQLVILTLKSHAFTSLPRPTLTQVLTARMRRRSGGVGVSFSLVSNNDPKPKNSENLMAGRSKRIASMRRSLEAL